MKQMLTVFAAFTAITVFTALAIDLMAWLEAERIPGMVIGGVAASLLGRPRLTQDVDALAILAESKWERELRAAAAHRIAPRIDDALEFARRARVLLLEHRDTGIEIDFTLGSLTFEQIAVERSERYEIDRPSDHAPVLAEFRAS